MFCIGTTHEMDDTEVVPPEGDQTPRGACSGGPGSVRATEKEMRIISRKQTTSKKKKGEVMRKMTVNRSRTLPAFVLLMTIMVHATCHGQGIHALQGIKSDGTIDSYQKIVAAAEPAAKDGNGIAINIYRQALYGVGKDQELEKGLQQDDAKPLDKDVEKKWLEFVRSQSEAGDQFYMNVQGIFYFKGYWVEQDQHKALDLWRQAAEKGSPIAHLKMANILAASGGRQNIDGMLEHYGKAADQGNLIALYNLGCLYYEDKFVGRDNEKAFNYFQKAAQGGHAVAQRNLGICYLKGQGTAKKAEKAKEWFEKAVDQGDEGAQPWLDQYFNENVVNLGGGMELRIASVKGDIKKYSEGSKIHIAAGIGDVEAVNKMLDAGVDADKRTEFFGNTPLHLAAVGKSMEAAKVLVKNGAEVNAKNRANINYGMTPGTPLHAAIRAGDTNLVSFLVDSGANIHAKDHNGMTPIMYARFAGNNKKFKAIVEYLVSKGADINAQDNTGDTAIMTLGNNVPLSFECMDIMIENGADITITNNAGRTVYERVAEVCRQRDRIRKYYKSREYPIPSHKRDNVQVDSLQNTKLPAEFKEHLLAYYPFDHPHDKMVMDRSGNKNDGDIHYEPEWMDGKFGGAYHFDYTFETIFPVQVLKGTKNNFTVAAWVYLEKEPAGSMPRAIFAHQWNGAWMMLNINRNGLAQLQIKMAINSRITNRSASSNEPLAVGKWYHIAGVFSGDELKLYVNGDIQKEKQLWEWPLDFDKSYFKTCIGGLKNYGSKIDFMIDEVRIFDCGLNDEEIKQLYNSGE